MLTAAILAGGRASRFGGKDKSALPVEGRSILDRQIAELSQLTPHLLLVGHDAGDDRVRAVPDLVPGCGPLGGLYTALTEAADDTVVVVACDMPYISAPLLAYLAALAIEADAVVPMTERGYHPLCAVYTRGCLDKVARRLTAGHLKMTDLLEDVRLRTVTADDLNRFGDRHRLLANVNTPAEYNSLEALQGHEL